MTTLETITQELGRIARERSIDSICCYANISIDINIGRGGGVGAPEVEIRVSEQGSTVAIGRGESLSKAWQAFQTDLNGPDAKALIRQADAEMGNAPDQAAGLRERVAEKSPHPKAGLWNLVTQGPGCWAVTEQGKCYYIDHNGWVTSMGNLSPLAVPNTWPIPESAKAKLRELDVPFDEAAAEIEKGTVA